MLESSGLGSLRSKGPLGPSEDNWTLLGHPVDHWIIPVLDGLLDEVILGSPKWVILGVRFGVLFWYPFWTTSGGSFYPNPGPNAPKGP